MFSIFCLLRLGQRGSNWHFFTPCIISLIYHAYIIQRRNSLSQIFSKDVLRSAVLLKKTLTQVFSCEYWGIFKSSFFYRTPTVANRKFCYHCLAFVFKTSFYFYKNGRLLSIVFISIWYSYSCELSVLYNFSVILTGLWNLGNLLYSQIWQKKLQTFLKWQPEAWVQCRFKSHFSGNLKNSPARFPSYFAL